MGSRTARPASGGRTLPRSARDAVRRAREAHRPLGRRWGASGGEGVRRGSVRVGGCGRGRAAGAVGSDGPGAAVGAGPGVGAVAGAFVGPAGEGLGAVMSPAQRREVLRVASGRVVRLRRSGRTATMWSRSVARASRPHQGKTQCRSRRMTCSRIHGGGSCWSTASVRLRSRTGRILALESCSQVRIRSRVAGPSFSTSPDRRVAAEVGGEVGQRDVDVEVRPHRPPGACGRPASRR